jgi:hypothetical protein
MKNSFVRFVAIAAILVAAGGAIAKVQISAERSSSPVLEDRMPR